MPFMSVFLKICPFYAFTSSMSFMSMMGCLCISKICKALFTIRRGHAETNLTMKGTKQ